MDIGVHYNGIAVSNLVATGCFFFGVADPEMQRLPTPLAQTVNLKGRGGGITGGGYLSLYN